ncbi:MAG: alkaline phosphatase, partial [Geobacteraceae bacterium]|nr:alkaline phosphatase [Geobacteraceae bacterium]
AGNAKNIIIMIPDGMGLADVTAARTFKNGPNGAPLSFETLKHIGYQRSHSANSLVTDSAAAASAWACGEKFANNEICYHGDGRPVRPSILELARKMGKATGLVTTDGMTEATPAAFGAHVPSRDCRREIGRQYLETTAVDILLGGGRSEFTTETVDQGGTKGNLLVTAQKKGYTVVSNREELKKAVARGSRKLLGLFQARGMTPEVQRPAASTEPRLPEMTAAALALLEKDRDGFFLLVEGALVDKANHRNNYPMQLGEVLVFDEAVAVVRDWIKADRKRKDETLLIVVADHETGGFAITGPDASLPGPGASLETAWTGRGHTAVDTMVWSEGPGSKNLARAMDNTDIYRVMAGALR